MKIDASDGKSRPRGSVLELASDLACVRLPVVNVYFIGERGAPDRGWTLIDAGLGISANSIRKHATNRFGIDSRPQAILLTHGHFDHTGALKRLAEQWDAPIYAHPSELPYLTGKHSYPAPDPSVGGGAMARLSWLYPRGPVDVSERVRALPLEGAVPGLRNWRWVHTPGHTPGHISFFRETDRALIAGDAFVTCKQESVIDALITQTPKVRRPPAYYTLDWDAARRSVNTLYELRPNLAGTGHGVPMMGKRLLHELKSLVLNWPKQAVPKQGRYVNPAGEHEANA